MDYPKDCYRIIILDDRNSVLFKEQVRDLIRQGNDYLFYTARGVNVKTDSKAANLNHGLRFVQNLSRGPAEYFAVLDTDMIPASTWLRSMLPHLLSDGKVVVATPPQYFYNISDGDVLGQSAIDFEEVTFVQ